jgi:hypothetical protein
MNISLLKEKVDMLYVALDTLHSLLFYNFTPKLEE